MVFVLATRFMQMIKVGVVKYSFQMVAIVRLEFVFLWTAQKFTDYWMMVDFFAQMVLQVMTATERLCADGFHIFVTVFCARCYF